jgi:hypothetical protein
MTLKTVAQEIEDAADMIILSIRLKSGRFEGSIQVPMNCTEEERQQFVESWFKMMEAGLKCGRKL